MTVDLAYSPCPNDTAAFYAARAGLVNGPEFTVSHADVETLNRRAVERARHEVTKLSFGALPYVLEDYALLRSGAALGDSAGPVVVSRDDLSPEEVDADVDVVVPGRHTTAYLLARARLEEVGDVDEARYDDVLSLVAEGEYDVGVVIHEGRFTYPDYGLDLVVDLGEWWDAETGLPLPLGCMAVRRDVDRPREIDEALRESVEYALSEPDDDGLAAYVREHAQEMDEGVLERHVSTYVNRHSTGLEGESREAVSTLLEFGVELGLLPDSPASLYAY
ncbi:MAG: menaquinone biosynthesis family protein [Halobacteriales archaeon]